MRYFIDVLFLVIMCVAGCSWMGYQKNSPPPPNVDMSHATLIWEGSTEMPPSTY